MSKNYDLTSRWSVIEANLLEQAPGGKFGKRRIVSAKPMRRERAQRLLDHCEEGQIYRNRVCGCKSRRTFELEEIKR